MSRKRQESVVMVCLNQTLQKSKLINDSQKMENIHEGRGGQGKVPFVANLFSDQNENLYLELECGPRLIT